MRARRTILAIELSTACGKIAVVRGDEILHSAEFTSQRSHNTQMFAPLRAALEAAGDALDLIVVGTGPGSYTGVRIALAAAHGISLSRNVPVVGWPSVTAPENEDANSFLVIGDARRGGYFGVPVRDGRFTEELKIFEEQELRDWLGLRSGEKKICFDAHPPLDLPEVQLCLPSAIKLAKMASALAAESISRLTAQTPEPIYIREAFITKAKRPFAVA